MPQRSCAVSKQKNFLSPRHLPLGKKSRGGQQLKTARRSTNNCSDLGSTISTSKDARHPRAFFVSTQPSCCWGHASNLLKALLRFARFRSHGVINHAAFLSAWIANQPSHRLWLIKSARRHEPRPTQVLERHQATAECTAVVALSRQRRKSRSKRRCQKSL